MHNWVLNGGLLFETLLGLLVVYVPFLHSAFQTKPLKFIHLLPAIPFVLFIFSYDELRKFLMRYGDKGGKGLMSKFGRFVMAYTYY
jgi:magnesium-transporting ATPase (P-type)